VIEIVRPGLEATVQDRGRVGFAHLGVPRGGAADRGSLDLANRLLGNDPEAAAVEFLLGGFAVRLNTPTPFVLTGAPVAATLDGVPVATAVWGYARAGQLLEAGRAESGLRTYLGVAGGIATAPVLGSRSTDTLSGVGPAVLAAGDRLPVGPAPSRPGTAADVVRGSVVATDPVPLRFRWGPRADWFTAAARRRLVDTTWTVSSEVDRAGARLLGPTLDQADDRQLPTEGMHPGSVQVPASGQPIVLLANHAPTGGYPVIGVVSGADLPVLAQLAPGRRLTMRALPN
jgi:biotin-dependent carboxylase-like uncharacterized protein